MTDKIFANRREAGVELARHLQDYRGHNPLVLGLPRGGIVVAYEVARELDAELDVIVANKVGAPGHPEFAIGAVAANGVRFFDERSVHAMGLSSQLDELAEAAAQETRRRMQAYRGDKGLPEMRQRTVIIVDDGLATGATARAAIEAARAEGPKTVALAVPVGAPDTVANFQGLADAVVCLIQPKHFRAVGLWYREFDQTTDAEVLRLLDHAHHAHRDRQ